MEGSEGFLMASHIYVYMYIHIEQMFLKSPYLHRWLHHYNYCKSFIVKYHFGMY